MESRAVSKYRICRYCTIINSESWKSNKFLHEKKRKHHHHPPIQICPLHQVFLDSTHNNIFQVSPSLSPTFATASSESKRIRPSGATSLKKPRAVVLKGHLNRFQVLLGCYLLGHGSKRKPRSRARRQTSFCSFRYF